MIAEPCAKCGYQHPVMDVPRLTDEDMHPRKIQAADGRSCLQGWRRRVFGPLAGHDGAELAQHVNDLLADAAGGKIDSADRREGAADLWNAVMEKLPHTRLVEIDVWSESRIEQQHATREN